ncbi:coproporphyrinogen III oxidase, anaerobic 1 [Amylibacter ulvae]|uniref:Coproporphyrinogen-III oxidase n=1 Tax=Paramylibacter ulvae TaxID=1651968 RepID=A0ABQ3CUI8_9RHOB|nr:oxygen-independent coproporphyrinogen III oxidase [Amylibacter ulvae]GHA43474.1 coproporphyrinogen III oxidase, anaerobic 1 [Amylibacter ulvae]
MRYFAPMSFDPELAHLGVYDARAPRYTSYPTAVHFHTDVGAEFSTEQIRTLPADRPISIYVHIPLCERLCWFCACRTQGTKNKSAIAHYLDVLLREIKMVGATLPSGVSVGKIHWGGGTPTILSPDQIRTLSTALHQMTPRHENFEFSVEIDPTLVSAAKIDALADVGMTRASIGVQDFDPRVQAAIGRKQSVETTLACVDMLRRADIHSLNMDILYGLPHQTVQTVTKTIETVLGLSPDRIALYGYAHVPWMAKRQKLISDDALPSGQNRRELFDVMASKLESAQYAPIGIDHFAKPDDAMQIAAKAGKLRRNFQGYTTDDLDTLIGLGASAISKFPNGFSQNAPKSADYADAITQGKLATYRGIATTQRDRMIARLIEMIMCDFRADFSELSQTYACEMTILAKPILQLQRDFGRYIQFSVDGFEITHHQRALARIIARRFDVYSDDTQNRFSSVS